MLGTHFSLLKYLQILSDILKQLSIPLIEDLAETIHLTWSQGGAVILYGEGPAATSAKLIGEYWAQNGLGQGLPESHPRTQIDVIPIAERQLHEEEGSTVPTDNPGLKRLERPAQPGDLLLIFSVSDPSSQIQKVVAWANRMGVITWALTAHHGGGLRKLAQHHLSVPLKDVGLVQSIHLALMHWVTDDISARLYHRGRYAPKSAPASAIDANEQAALPSG